MNELSDLKAETGAELRSLFDQVWVVSLKRRPDRMNRFREEIKAASWPFRDPVVFDAIDGSKVGIPKVWRTGAGSYGCLRSHMNILERAIMDDVECLLVLEDDAVFEEGFDWRVAAFMKKVPADWDCIMFGGQHIQSVPIPVCSGVVRAGGGGGIQRTHCYAIRGEAAMKALYQTWANAAVHCDWVMGPCMAAMNTYAPTPFLVGQADGRSDISGSLNSPNFWRTPSGEEPIIVLHVPRHVMEILAKKGFYRGKMIDRATGFDEGLRDLFLDKTLDNGDREDRLVRWINVVQAEALSLPEGGVCTLWHPEVRGTMIQPLVKGKVVEIIAHSVKDALKQVPPDVYCPPANDTFVALLRSPRQVMEELRKRGWYTGDLHDDATGLNDAIRHLLSTCTDADSQALGLKRLAKDLYRDARKIPNGVATIWHDAITLDLLAVAGVEAIEVCANSVEQAENNMRRWSKAPSR